MTAERLATFHPVPGIDRRYKVNLLADRYDTDTRTSRIVTAIGPGSAKDIALDKVRNDPRYPSPDACVTGVYLLCDDCPDNHEAHEGQCRRGWYSATEYLRCGCGA